jgi:hypothetical protein
MMNFLRSISFNYLKMKKIILFLLVFITICFSCKKSTDNTWTEEEKASYQAVISLQEQAAENYTTWMKTMDSLEVLAQLQQFFLSDPTVLSASINSQGLMVEYANGMGGGFFLNPKDHPELDSSLVPSTKADCPYPKLTPIVNNKSMVLLDPHYWDRTEETDQMMAKYNLRLPQVGMSLERTYLNQEADVDQFTKLSGYSIIQIYSHGLAYPNEQNIENVYIYTGEEANEVTSETYHDEILNKDILVLEDDSPYGLINRYFISDKFLAEHNDFSEDTVLFLGAFCYSNLGKMPEIQKSFAAGTYMGFDWSVFNWKCCNWCVNLIGSLCDKTAIGYPLSTQWWYAKVNQKYYDNEDNRYVSVLLTGDTTYLWKTPPPDVETLDASNLSDNAATLNGKVNPENFSTKAYFEYGLTTDYGKTSEVNDLWWGSTEWTTINAQISGLTANAVYHYRIRAKSDMGTSVGEDMTFETVGMPHLAQGTYGLYIGSFNTWECPENVNTGQDFYIPRIYNTSGEYITCTCDGQGNILINWTTDNESCTGSGTILPHHIDNSGWMPLYFYTFNINFEYTYNGYYKYSASLTGVDKLDSYLSSIKLVCAGAITHYYTDNEGNPQNCSYPKSFSFPFLHDFGK